MGGRVCGNGGGSVSKYTDDISTDPMYTYIYIYIYAIFKLYIIYIYIYIYYNIIIDTIYIDDHLEDFVEKK